MSASETAPVVPYADPGPTASGVKESARLHLDALAGSMSRLALETIGKRQTIEQRWLEDLRQYNGTYDDEILAKLKAADSSMVYVNITRTKTRTAKSRIGDMLFPTDDRNWGLGLAPNPQLNQFLSNDEVVGKTPSGTPVTKADVAQHLHQEAQNGVEAMQDVIEGQLAKAFYEANARESIHNACVVGTGVLKGPIVVGTKRRTWAVESDGTQHTRVLKEVLDMAPTIEAVDPWNFFPDMAVTRMKDAKFVFERRYLHARDLKKLASDPSYLADNVKDVLKRGAKVSQISRNPTAEKRAAGYQNYGDTAIQVDDDRYEVWEYHGPIDAVDLVASGILKDKDLGGEYGDLNEVSGCVVFAGSVVIKVYLNPLETGDLPYSVFCWERDEACIFGYGVPYRMRNAQKIYNAAWRMLLDNAGLSVGGQIVVNKTLVQPESDNDYRLKPRKVWTTTKAGVSVHEIFGLFEVPMHQQELQAIITIARMLADEETGISQLAEGDQGPHITKTVQGMAMLMNSTNAQTRDSIKVWDDDNTVPLIGRFLDWNMQNHEDENIKGEYEPIARGSAVLLAREVQSQNLMTLAFNFSANPVFAPMIKAKKLFGKIVQSMHLTEDDIIKSDQEMAQDAEEAKNNPPQVPMEMQLEQMRQQFQVALKQMDVQTKAQLQQMQAQLREAELTHEQEIAALEQRSKAIIKASDGNMKLAIADRQHAHQRQLQADQLRSAAAGLRRGA